MKLTIALLLCVCPAMAQLPKNPSLAFGSGGGSGTVTSVATSCGITGGTITTTGTVSGSTPVTAHNGNYTLVASDCGASLTTNALATYTVPQAGSTGFPAGYYIKLQNVSASSTLTLSTATSAFYGAGASGTSVSVSAGNGVQLVSDATNWQVYPFYITGSGTVTNVATACGITGGAITTTGTISGSSTSTAHNGTYTVLSTDCGNEVTSNVTAAWTLPQAGSGGFGAGTHFILTNTSTTPNTQIAVTTTTSVFAGCGRSGSVTWIPAGTTMRFISTGGNWALDNCSALTMTLIDASARGVISDGTTDNATILATLTSVSGGTIVLPAGAVTASTGFVIAADAITIDCQGGTLKLLSGGTGIIFTQFHFAQHFENCHYDGNSLTAGITQVLNFQNLTDFVFENNTVQNCGAISGSNFQNCMLAFNITGGKIAKNTFTGAAGNALSVNTSQSTNTLSIDSNYFVNVSNGISATGSYGLSITGNHCRTIHNDPANTGTGQNGNCITLFQSHGGTVTGNEGRYMAYSGIRMSQTENTSATGNTFQYVGDAGIYFESPGGTGGQNNTAENNTFIDAKAGLNCVNTSDFQNYGCNFTGNTVSNMFGVGSDPAGTADAAGAYVGRFAKVVANNINGAYYGILTETSTSTQWAALNLTATGNTITELRPVTVTTTGNTGTLTVGDTISTANNVRVGVVTNITSQTKFTLKTYRGFFAAADSITSIGGYAATVSTVLGPALERVTLSGVSGTFQQFDFIYKGASLAAATCTGLLTRVTSGTDITVELMPVPGGPATTCAFVGTDTITGSISGATATISALGTVPGTICSATSVCAINLWAALVPLIDSSPVPTQFYTNNVASGYSTYYIRGYSGTSFFEPTATVAYSDPSIHTLTSNPQTATYQVVSADFVNCKTIPVSSGSFTVTLVDTSIQPPNGECIYVFNYGTGNVTIARSGQLINGGSSSLVLLAGTSTSPSGAFIISDGTNYTASVISGGAGTVTSVGSACGIAGGTITLTGTLQNSITVAAHNGNYSVVTGDCGKSITSNTTATYTLAAAGSTGFLAGYYIFVQNVSASNSITITTTTSAFYGAGTSGTSLTVTAGNAVKLVSDGNNWEVYPNYIGGTGTVTSVATACGVTGGTITSAGTITGSTPITAHNGNYSILTGDCGASLTTNTTATYTIPQAGSAGFLAGYRIMLQNVSGANTLTLSTSTSAFYGAGTSGTSVSVAAGNGVTLVSDGTNWEVYPAFLGGSGTVTSVATGCGLTGGTITSTGTLSETIVFGVHNGNYSILTGDCGKSLTTNTTATYTFPQAGSAGFLTGWYATVQNISAANTLTLSTTTSNFYGAGASGTSFTLAIGSAATLISDGTNWQILLQPLVTQTHAFGYTFDGGGSALSSGLTKYVTIPLTCTLKAWNIAVDTGTATLTTWKIATGTAIPTVTNTISTSGVAISTGTAIHSATMSDFTTTAVTANDIFGFHLQAVSGATYVNFILECDN